MMLVVKNIPQLEKAIQENVLEIMIVGKQASEILAAISRPAAEEEQDYLGPIRARVKDDFEILEFIDNNLNAEIILLKKPDLKLNIAAEDRMLSAVY
jgi:hypothetical protein